MQLNMHIYLNSLWREVFLPFSWVVWKFIKFPNVIFLKQTKPLCFFI